MSGGELRAVRHGLGLSAAYFARAVGLRGKYAGISVFRWERDASPIPGTVERMALHWARRSAERPSPSPYYATGRPIHYLKDRT